MGFLKNMKKTAATNDASRAIEEGRSVFICRVWDEVIAYQGTGAVSGAAETIEEVEALGWQLNDFSYSWVPEKKRGVTVCLFRHNAT